MINSEGERGVWGEINARVNVSLMYQIDVKKYQNKKECHAEGMLHEGKRAGDKIRECRQRSHVWIR